MHRNNSSKRHAQRGFTLIEVMVSLLIFSFGVLGVVGMQARAVQFSTQAGDRARAALLANEIVAKMWTQKSVALGADVITAWQARVRDAKRVGLPSGEGSVETGTDAGGVPTATVKITWHPPSATSDAKDNQFVTKVAMP
jgi:type IV pilus assembly protein PilV